MWSFSEAFRAAAAAPPLPAPYRREKSGFKVLGHAPRDTARWPRHISENLTPRRLTSILRDAETGHPSQYFELLQDLAGKDGLLSGLIATRLSNLSKRKVRCVARDGDDRGRAREVAQFCQETLDNLSVIAPQEDGSARILGGLWAVVEGLCWAFYYGVSAGWIKYGRLRGDPRARAAQIEFFDERRFEWDVQTETLRIQTEENPSPGLPRSAWEPLRTFEIRNNRISRRLAMSGAGRGILLPYMLRTDSLKDLLTYLEVWGLPSIIGVMPQEVAASFGGEDGTDGGLATARRFFQDLAGDARALLPPGFDIKVIQAVAGGEKVFETLESLTERMIQFAIVGQTGTSAANNTNRASAEVSERVQNTLTDGDAAMVAGGLEQILSHSVALWFGEGTPPAQVEFEPTQEERAARLEYLARASEVGIPVALEDALRDAGLREPPHGARLLDGSTWDADGKARVKSAPPTSENTND